MFVSREVAKMHMPPCFRKFKDIRVIIDCFEFVVENLLTRRLQILPDRETCTPATRTILHYKCLIVVAPNAVCEMTGTPNIIIIIYFLSTGTARRSCEALRLNIRL